MCRRCAVRQWFSKRVAEGMAWQCRERETQQVSMEGRQPGRSELTPRKPISSYAYNYLFLLKEVKTLFGLISMMGLEL